MDKVVKLSMLAAAPAVVAGLQIVSASESEKPNVVWYMTEDTSPQYLALYNDGRGASSPRLEELARDGITFNNAFSNAPVSSAARTTLITGCYAPRFGGSLHRHLGEKSIPDNLNMFPSYLRSAGYYTCNAQKTDYNVDVDPTAWDMIDGKVGGWRDRESEDQPFFYVRTNAVTHESSLLFKQEVYESKKTNTNPDDVYVHPSLPNTELMRYTYATFYDRIKDSDDEFGQIIDMLEEDGLMDNTFIFYFGDNGGCVPQSKGYTMDVGLRVPLVVYVPERWRDEVGIPAGSQHDGLVSFMDFGATILNLAGIEIPEGMDGKPFLGEKSTGGAESVVCYGDRFDDLYAFNRVLYRGDYRYARNYQPYHTRGMHAYYRYKSLAFQESREMYYAGELNADQAKFFEPMGVEELYDLKSDPDELNNLANDPKYSSLLKKMRGELSAKLDSYCDLGFLPETIIHEQAMPDQGAYGKSHKKELMTYRKIADLQMLPYAKASKGLVAAINSQDDVEQWWALASGVSFADEIYSNDEFVSRAKELASDDRSYVSVRAMLFLSKGGVMSITASQVKDLLKNSTSLAETLLVLNDLTYLKECGLMPDIALGEDDVCFTNYSVGERLIYISK